MNTHTLSVLVENKPGVLARISGLFARRGYNIDSLAVGPTERPEISRITLRVSVSTPQILEQIVKQLNKLVEVLKIVQQMQEGVEKPRPKVEWSVGELVRVKDGPFTDFNGAVEDVNYDKSKVRVSVTIFGRATPVELDFAQVEKV